MNYSSRFGHGVRAMGRSHCVRQVNTSARKPQYHATPAIVRWIVELIVMIGVYDRDDF